MAIFVEGMKCRLCGKAMHMNQEHIAFPAFVPNQLDPLSLFDDATFHTECFHRHPLAGKSLARLHELEENISVWPPVCAICNRTITDPDDYFTFSHLTEDKAAPLHRY